MKKQLLSLVFLITLIGANAQNVGIGTTSPNPSALLDLNSTTRGFLLPRVTTTQMFNIQNPANGLMVFNATYNELYHFDGTTWRPLLTGSYWIRPLANRDIMSNTSDSIGIGTNIPTKFMDVNGTMRVRGTLTADGSIDATSMILSNTFLAGSGLVNGSLQTNDELVINNSSAILQLKAGAANKGFLQLSGDNLRIGTNSENTDGKFVIRVGGADRISVDNEGTMNITGKITSDQTGSSPLTPLCWGVTINVTGAIGRGTNNTSILRLAKGRYRLTCPGITENSCAVFSPGATGITIGHISYDGYIDIYVRKSDTAEDFDMSFSFIVF